MTEDGNAFDRTNVAALMALGTLAGTPRTVGPTPVVAHPKDWTITDLSHLLDRPPRRTGKTVLERRDSFVHMCERECVTDETVYFAGSRSIVGIVDFHTSAGEAGKREYMIIYRAALSPEWEAWTKFAGAWHSQLELAEFIEDRIEDIDGSHEGAPTGSTMLSLARELSITRNVAFQSRADVHGSTISLKYEENDRTGAIEAPEQFFITLPVFQDEAHITVRCRFRYRMSEARLSVRVDVPRAADVAREEFERITAEIASELDVEIYHGSHEC